MLDNIPTIEEMTNFITSKLMSKYAVKATEISPYRDTIRFDILGINRNQKEIRIIETKSCRQDFISDKKWQSYLPYCTHFAFAAPKGVIKKDELPKGIGLIEFWYEESNYIEYGQKYDYLSYQYTKGCVKLRDEISNDRYVSLLEAIVMRLIYEHERYSNYGYILEKLNKIESMLITGK